MHLGYRLRFLLSGLDSDLSNTLTPTTYAAIGNSIPTPPMPMLAALREAVLARSIKRIPEWKFCVASDIVMQIQPRPATRTKANRGGLPWFDCIAIVRDGVDET